MMAMVRKPSPEDRAAAERLLAPRTGFPKTSVTGITAWCSVCNEKVEMQNPERSGSPDNNRWRGTCSRGHIVFRVTSRA
jgi:hypothetical protein